MQEQFVFLHDAVLESLTCGNTQIAAGDLRTGMKKLNKNHPNSHFTGFDHEFKVQSANSLHLVWPSW